MGMEIKSQTIEEKLFNILLDIFSIFIFANPYPTFTLFLQALIML